MVGSNALAMSVDFAHYARRWSLQSEGTLDASGGTAFAAFLRCQLTASDILLLQLRHFSGHNIAPSARTFQQGSKVQNEMGLLLGYETARWRKLRWQSFAQIYHHPLPTWRAAAPSSGLVLQTLFTYAPHRREQWSLRYRLTSKQQTIPQHAPLLQWVMRQSLRLQHQYSSGAWMWQTNLDGSMTQQQVSSTPHFGAMLSLRLRYAPQTVWHASAFVGVFSAERFDARLFVYQPQLPSTGAFPSFYGTGCSAVAVASWIPSRAWSLSARVGLTQHWSRPFTSSASCSTVNPTLSFQGGLWLRHRF